MAKGVFWSAFAGSFFGRLTAFLLIGILLFLGIGSDKIVEIVVFGLLSPSIARWIAVGLALLIFVLVLVVPTIIRVRRFKQQVDWSIRKALNWITFESRWSWKELSKMHWYYPLGAPQELTEKALAGRVVIQGRLRGQYEFEDIMRDYWNVMQFKVDEYLYGHNLMRNAPEVRTEARKLTRVSVPDYEEYRVPADQVKSCWPRARWWYRWLMRCVWAGRVLTAWIKSKSRRIKRYVAR